MSHSEICPVCGGAGKIRTYLDPLGFGYLTSGKIYIEKKLSWLSRERLDNYRR